VPKRVLGMTRRTLDLPGIKGLRIIAWTLFTEMTWNLSLSGMGGYVWFRVLRGNGLISGRYLQHLLSVMCESILGVK
jgi:hypothetical protein